MYFLFANQLRDSGLPADVLVGKLKKDISFALRRGTIALVTTHALDAAQRAVENESLALNRRAGGLGSLDSLLLPSSIHDDALTHPTHYANQASFSLLS